MNKKFFIFVLAAAGVIFVLTITLPKSTFFNQSVNILPSPILTQTPSDYQVKVIISAPDENFLIEYETINKRLYQPFSILKEALDQNNIQFETETYNFGVFVKSINGFESTGKKAWIYFVNGESGQVAADKMELKKSDIVEWKYIPPSE